MILAGDQSVWNRVGGAEGDMVYGVGGRVVSYIIIYMNRYEMSKCHLIWRGWQIQDHRIDTNYIVYVCAYMYLLSSPPLSRAY